MFSLWPTSTVFCIDWFSHVQPPLNSLKKSHLVLLYNPFKVMVDFVFLIFEDFLIFINERYWSIVFLWYFCLVLDQSNSDIIELIGSVTDRVTLWIVLGSKGFHNTIPRQGGSNNSHLLSHSSRCWESKFKMLAGLISLAVLHPALHKAPSCCVFTWTFSAFEHTSSPKEPSDTDVVPYL